ncbi:hypothetical protein HNY73_013999 [Argiope bruennichi]|uniref:Uncharacterized protein n=1 Tax=Argiope bruennichi TaxID=94029 RepID=A0A8T0ERK4_ARGBR|nr:hypothetical protein HNY73_013999 [Argiope bruennichi]
MRKHCLLYQEVDEPPEIDPSWFEMDEPELMEIFETSKNIFSVFDNPSENDFATNPFLAKNPFELTNTNPFKESIIAKNNPFSGISNEQNVSELNTCSCPKQDTLTLVASRPNHYLKRKVNKVASWKFLRRQRSKTAITLMSILWLQTLFRFYFLAIAANLPFRLCLTHEFLSCFLLINGSRLSIILLLRGSTVFHFTQFENVHRRFCQLVVPDLESRFRHLGLRDFPKRSVTSAVPRF